MRSIERHRECSREYMRLITQRRRARAFSEIAAQLPSWCRFSDLRKIPQLFKHRRFGPISLARVYELIRSGKIQSWKVPGTHRVSCERAIAFYYEKLRVKPADDQSFYVAISVNPVDLRDLKNLHREGAFKLMRWQRAYRLCKNGHFPVWDLGNHSTGPKLYSCKEFIEEGLERFLTSRGYKFPFAETYYGRHRREILRKAKERYAAQKRGPVKKYQRRFGAAL
jgi:hypothetical protein